MTGVLAWSRTRTEGLVATGQHAHRQVPIGDEARGVAGGVDQDHGTHVALPHQLRDLAHRGRLGRRDHRLGHHVANLHRVESIPAHARNRLAAMAALTPREQAIRDRVESLIALAEPALDLLLAVGDRVSRLVDRGDDWDPPRPLAESGDAVRAGDARAPGP